MVEGIDVPAQRLHGVHQFRQPVQVVQRAVAVIAGLFERIALRDGHRAGLAVLEHVELGFQSEIHHIAEIGGLDHVLAC
jgi:hypothetical protein